MTLDVVLRNCRVADPFGTFECDIGVDGGKIVSVSRTIDSQADLVIDASGMVVIPGAIDGHVHFEMAYGSGISTADDFDSGSAAASCGGVTTFIDFVTPERGASLLDAFEERLRVASRKARVDFGFHVCVVEWGPRTMAELQRLVDERGVGSIKVFTAYSKRGLMLDDGSLLQGLGWASDKGVLTLCHCENEWIVLRETERLADAGNVDVSRYEESRPDVSEAEAVLRVGYLSSVTGAKTLVVHLSSKKGLETAATVRRMKARLHVETCPHYLLLSKVVYERPDGGLYVMAPPLRSKDDCEALWSGLSKGEIDVVGSDHAPYSSAHKLRSRDFREIPGGVQGTEVIVPLLFSEGVKKGRITLEQLVRLTSYNPARIYGLYPSKGRIAVGADADIVLINPDLRVRLGRDVLHSRLDFSIYEGLDVTGYPVLTLSRGEVVAQDGEPTSKPGRGKYLHRSSGHQDST
ncbi:MAG: dihydropyrimidinase [Thaumarchaeota archaeon]|nr:dihydropyrimidinase [Candidatus Calditenuaceae archaeon]MDW8187641.1 dihydropyrimidinase [Nitrososphaerota archaeon]